MMKSAVQAISATVILFVVGLLSVWAGQLWLIPSLGSASFVQVLEPTQPSSKPRCIAGGQFMGLLGGFAGVYAASAAAAPSFTADHRLVLARVLAVAVAVIVTLLLQLASDTKNAAGGTLALILALGVEPPDWTSAWQIIVGILLVTVLGEIARRLIVSVEARGEPVAT